MDEWRAVTTDHLVYCYAAGPQAERTGTAGDSRVASLPMPLWYLYYYQKKDQQPWYTVGLGECNTSFYYCFDAGRTLFVVKML